MVYSSSASLRPSASFPVFAHILNAKGVKLFLKGVAKAVIYGLISLFKLAAL